MSDFLFLFLFLTIVPVIAGLYSVLVTTLLIPIYPAVIAGGTLHGIKHALLITLGFVLSFTVFTLSLNTIVYGLYLDPDIIRTCAILYSALLGIALIFLNLIKWSLIYGLIIGFVWAFWVGPFMPQLDYYEPTSVDWYLTCLTFMFGVGAGLFVLFSIWVAQKILEKSNSSPAKIKLLRQLLGGLFILVSLLIAFHVIDVPAREEFKHPEANRTLKDIFPHLQKPSE